MKLVCISHNGPDWWKATVLLEWGCESKIIDISGDGKSSRVIDTGIGFVLRVKEASACLVGVAGMDVVRWTVGN
jgi:hypothetical protein